MWKSIKRFFKWIADHTGISWILGKISSCCSSIKSCWSGQPRKNDLIELITGKSDDWGIIKENDNKQLILHIEKKNVQEIMGVKNINYQDPLRYHVHVKCDKGIFKIACGKPLIISNSMLSFIVESVEGSKTLSNELEAMKKMLGLNGEHTVGTITQMFKDPIKPEVASSEPKVSANSSKKLSSETVNDNSKPGTPLKKISQEQMLLKVITSRLPS